jgi:hypothetical protein
VAGLLALLAAALSPASGLPEFRNPGGAEAATPSELLVFGDVSCSSAVDAEDALLVLWVVAGYGVVAIFCSPYDVDCDGDVDAVDALKILRHIAALPVKQTQPCLEIGSLFSP